MQKDLSNDEALKKMKELIDSVNICMYASADAGTDGASRPMSTAKVEDDGTIWFFTDESTGAGREAGAQLKAALHYSSPAKNSYLCVLGDAELSQDKSKMEELWSDMLKTWWPDGLETPGITLIRVSPSSAHYWDSDASRLRLMYSYVKAKITGEPADGSEGDEGRLNVA